MKSALIGLVVILVASAVLTTLILHFSRPTAPEGPLAAPPERPRIASPAPRAPVAPANPQRVPLDLPDPGRAVAAAAETADEKAARALEEFQRRSSTHPKPGPDTTGLAVVEPTEEGLRELEDLSRREDAEGLLDLFRRDKSILRYEALRRYMELSGPEAAKTLVDLLASEDDAALHGLLATALAAGGQMEQAQQLTEMLDKLESDSARIAAAGALASMSERLALPASSLHKASATLNALARSNPEQAAAACSGLASCGESGVNALAILAVDGSVDEGTRLAAAEALAGSRPAQALSAFQALAESAEDPAVRDAARIYAERMQGQ